MYTSVVLSLIATYIVLSVVFLGSLWLLRRLTDRPVNAATAFAVLLLLCWMVLTLLLDLVVLGTAITLMITGTPPVWS